jgi:endonuclease/exonuclease/phosphatase family metal-dependent hydrolase
MTRSLTLLTLAAALCWACTNKEAASREQTMQASFMTDSVLVKPADFEYTPDSAFKVLSWNVEHFVDAYDDPYIDNERENLPLENMPLRLNLLLKALKKANADIVVLQEFESAKFLRQLAKDSLPDIHYRYFADIPSHNWYMNVVVMSRFPMGIINGYGSATTPLPAYVNEEGKKETQNQLNTRMWSIDIFPSENYSFLLTGVHLKAGRGERNSAMRKGQLKLLVNHFNHMLAKNPEKNMMLAGDLNATPGSEELGLLLANPFLDAVDTAIYSHPANKPRWRLDYMLINENMQPEALENSIEVEHFFSRDSMRIISDHLPLMGAFSTKDRSANF